MTATTIMASMGSLAHYMQELSQSGFDLATSCTKAAARSGTAPSYFERRAVRGMGAGRGSRRRRRHAGPADPREPGVLAGYDRVCEGGNVALYRRRLVTGRACGSVGTRAAPRGAVGGASRVGPENGARRSRRPARGLLLSGGSHDTAAPQSRRLAARRRSLHRSASADASTLSALRTVRAGQPDPASRLLACLPTWWKELRAPPLARSADFSTWRLRR